MRPRAVRLQQRVARADQCKDVVRAVHNVRGRGVLAVGPAAPPRDFIGGVVQTDNTLKETRTGGASDSDSTDRAA